MNNNQPLAIKTLRLQWLNAFIWRQTELIEALPDLTLAWDQAANSNLFGGVDVRELGNELYDYYSTRITFQHAEHDVCVLAPVPYPSKRIGTARLRLHTIVAALNEPDRVGELVERASERFSNATLTVSHLCCDARCLNPRHVTLETLAENMSRNDCAFEGSCRHRPSCVFPWYLEEQQRNVKNKHWPRA